MSPFSFLFRNARLTDTAFALLFGLGCLFPLSADATTLPEWLNDPFFHPEAEGARPGYYGQWYLHNQMPTQPGVNAGLDVRIAGAWARGLTGNGVIIGVIDDALEGEHPDLVENYRNEFSWDFTRTAEEQLDDPYRSSPSDSLWAEHGTMVAGVAAGRGGNGIGITGAAPLAGVAGVRYVTTGAITPANHAAAILFQGGDDPFTPHPGWSDPDWVPPVRVKNHSYGVPVGFAPTDPSVKEALKTSAGHGVIHLFSAGNARPFGTEPGNSFWSTQDANKNDIRTTPHGIVVAALGSDGKHTYYSSYGANVFVTAPSSSAAGTYGIPTTDLVGRANGNNEWPERADDEAFPGAYDYTSLFGGTSASTPLVAGIMALGVEANPALNVRMAQHLLARTSRIVDADDASATGGWVTNGAGYAFNQNYGFGLIDADAFTLAATQVASLSELVVHEGDRVEVSRSFSDQETTLTEHYTLSLDPTGPEPLPLEYVRVHFTISGLQSDWYAYTGEGEMPGIGAIAGDLELWLTSPDGTRSRLINNDRNLQELSPFSRDFQLETLEWSALSYAFWGEEVIGEWTLELSNASINSLALFGGTWETYQLEFGTGSIEIIPEPSPLALLLLVVAATGGWRALRWRRKCFLRSTLRV